MRVMRHTAWTLLFALLLQLVAGSAWARHGLEPSPAAAHCHEPVVQGTAAAQAHHAQSPAAPQGKVQHLTVQADSHHCCAVGLGTGVQAWLLPLPQAAPSTRHGPWFSRSLRPDLRPPI